MGLDVQKKTDGGVNILGEVATDPVAAWMIQMAQVLYERYGQENVKVADKPLVRRNTARR